MRAAPVGTCTNGYTCPWGASYSAWLIRGDDNNVHDSFYCDCCPAYVPDAPPPQPWLNRVINPTTSQDKGWFKRTLISTSPSCRYARPTLNLGGRSAWLEVFSLH